MDNIDRKYKLPPPLPTIQNGKPQPIYPLMLEHKGDNNQLFAGKYVGEIEHIYDLFYKLITCQSIDENNPLEHEAKIHNNNFYIYQNGKWVLIGDIRKPYFGAIDYMESTFDKQIDNLNYLKNEFQEIAKDGKNEINSVIDEARNINLQINDAARIVDEASLQAQINAKSVNIRQYKNIETMKQSTNVTDDLLIATQGFIAAGDGGNAQYYVMPENIEAEADGYTVIDVRERESGAKVGSAKVGSARTTVYKNRKIGLLTPNFVDVRWFGAKLDGTTDDSDAFNRAVKFLVDKRNRFDFNYITSIASGTLYVPKGIMKINKAIEIDAGSMGVIFDGTIIDATEISTDYAVRLYSSTWSHLSSTAMHNLEGLILRGNRNEQKTAIFYDGVPQFNLKKSFITGFYKGAILSNDCYIYNFYDVIFDRCSDVCFENPSGLSNAGERINFIGCTLCNSNLAIRNANPNGAIHLLNCSIDYNVQAFDISDSSIIFCTDCHFEWAKYETPHFILKNSSCMLKINGGYMVSRPEVDYGEEIPELNCIFDNKACDSTGGIILDNVHIHNIKSNYLFSGVNYQIKNSKTYNPFTLPPLCEQDIDYSSFESSLDSFIKTGNSTTAYVDGTNISIKRTDYTNEAGFSFFKKIDVTSSGFGNVVLEFMVNNTNGGAINISLSGGYENKDGTIKTMEVTGFADIREQVKEAGANNKVRCSFARYIDNNLLLFGKNYNKNIYVCVSVFLWGVTTDTIFKFNKMDFEQY